MTRLLAKLLERQENQAQEMDLKEGRPGTPSQLQISPLNHSNKDTAASTTDHWMPQPATFCH